MASESAASVQDTVGAARVTQQKRSAALLAAHRATKRRRSAIVALLRITYLGGLVLAWELASGPVLDPFWISKPSLIVADFVEWYNTGELFRHAGSTLQATAIGGTLGVTGAVALGIALGLNRFLKDVLAPILYALFAVPRLALAPLIILLFGIGLVAKVAVVILVVFFLVLFNVFAGIDEMDSSAINAVRIMGASRVQQLRLVVLPSVLTWVLAGLRLSIRYALQGAILAEFMASSHGLGYVLRLSAGNFDTTRLYMVVMVILAISVVLYLVLGRVERSLLAWRGESA